MTKKQAKVVKFSPGKKLPVITGKLVFQFDDEAPIQIANVFDNKPIYLTIEKGKEDVLRFEGTDGKLMKLFIEDI